LGLLLREGGEFTALAGAAAGFALPDAAPDGWDGPATCICARFFALKSRTILAM